MTRHGSARPAARLGTLLLISANAVWGWLRGDGVRDERGSDSSEKAFMVILAITLGSAVTAAAVAFVASKTDLFK